MKKIFCLTFLAISLLAISLNGCAPVSIPVTPTSTSNPPTSTSTLTSEPPTITPTLTPVFTDTPVPPTDTPTPQLVYPRIAFSSFLAGEFSSFQASGYASIFSMNADGSAVIQLTYNPDGSDDNPSWSLDGSLIAYDSVISHKSDIFVMNSDGTNKINLTNTEEWEDKDPAWSPDGKKIAFSSNRGGDTSFDIYVMDKDGSNVIQLTKDISYETSPAWSPDGTYIAFVRNPLAGGSIFVMRANGSQIMPLTKDPLYGEDPAWSPDGAAIAFACWGDGIHYGICTMDANGRNIAQVSDVGRNSSPAWSPDGQQIAFVSKRDDMMSNTCAYFSCNFEVYIMNADGSSIHRLTHALLPDTHPAWSPEVK